MNLNARAIVAAMLLALEFQRLERLGVPMHSQPRRLLDFTPTTQLRWIPIGDRHA